jgi:hypothetical protein
MGFDAVGFPNLKRQRLEPIPAAGHEHQVVPASPEITRDLSADPTARARDERDGTGLRRRLRHRAGAKPTLAPVT